MKKESKWLTTEEVMQVLMNEPDVEMEFTASLGGMLRSTHWLTYHSREKQFADDMDWGHPTLYTADEFVQWLGNRWWRRDA